MVKDNEKEKNKASEKLYIENCKKTIWMESLVEGADLVLAEEHGCTGYDPKMGCFALEHHK